MICGRCGTSGHLPLGCRLPFKTLKIRSKTKGFSRSRRRALSYTPPWKAEEQNWNRAIDVSDSHSMRCKSCNLKTRGHDAILAAGGMSDPYKPCRKALSLWKSERKAMTAYLAKGGELG